jgi:multicomponent Na+:H+ antiporter subunit D
VLNAGYFLPIVFRAFFRAPPEAGHGAHGDPAHAHGEAPWPIVLALTLTAAGAVALFFFPQIPFALAQMMIGR